MTRVAAGSDLPGDATGGLAFSVSGGPEACFAARRAILAGDGAVPAAARDDILLLLSELVTNAILHAHTPIELGVRVDGGRALVCVADRMPGSEPLTPRVHSGDRPGGRGLALVADLSDDWGTTTFTGGKTVWFTLPLSMSAERMAAS
jgi:signal transduction histidine kinase